ncbi:CBS domain-containing protein [Pelagovum pacificum]|nr:CBS domain-containing protein [Pelagovum pacificum]QQA42122.1 CBS domain-containing protein [Pelagovum pacificum]
MTPATNVRVIAQVMDDHEIGAVAVLDPAGKLIGIVTERDIIRRAICANASLTETTAEEIMTPDPVTAPPEATLAEALLVMSKGRFRHLPVERDGQVVGMISLRDIPPITQLLAERFEAFRNSAPGMRMYQA